MAAIENTSYARLHEKSGQDASWQFALAILLSLAPTETLNPKNASIMMTLIDRRTCPLNDVRDSKNSPFNNNLPNGSSK